MDLSKRAKLVPESPIRKLAKLGKEAKAHGTKIYHLNIGQPDLPPPQAVFDFLHNYQGPIISYSDSQGEKEFLESLVSYYHRLGHNDLDEDNFIATLGGSEAISWAMITIADANEEILVFEPFYTNYHSFAEMADIKLVPIETKVEDGFHLPNKEEILSKINSKTKGILICNPNNPTGTVYTHEELKMLYQICKEKGLYLLVDEVYREFVYNDHKAISALTIEKDPSAGSGQEKKEENDLSNSRVIILDSFSKRYSLCGARIGFACSRNKKIITTMLKYGQARLAAASVNQLMTAKAIQESQEYMDKTIIEFTQRRKIIIEGLNKIPETVFQKPEGAFYVTVKLPVGDSEAFSRWLLTDFNDQGETIMLAPASGFYLTEGLGKEEVRIAYVLNETDLKRAMDILAKAISVWAEKK